MRTVLSFDEIHKPRSLPFEQYFGEMDLSGRQKEERIELAKDLEARLLYFMDAVALYLNDGVGDTTQLLTLLITEFEEAFNENRIEEKASVVPDVIADLLYRVDDDDFVHLFSVRFAQEVLDSTLRNIEKPETLSADRAKLIAEEDANTVYNRVEFVKAVRRGKTHKRWITQRDSKVRATHKAVDSKAIPIADYFTVGNARMLYPRDIVNGGMYPEEIVNCRCTCIYY